MPRLQVRLHQQSALLGIAAEVVVAERRLPMARWIRCDVAVSVPSVQVVLQVPRSMQELQPSPLPRTGANRRSTT